MRVIFLITLFFNLSPSLSLAAEKLDLEEIKKECFKHY